MSMLTPHEKFFEAAEIANFTKNEMRGYRESQKEMWDLYAITSTAEEKGVRRGRAEGRAEGREEGRSERNLEIARNMKKDGMPVDVIVRYTGIAEEEISKL